MAKMKSFKELVQGQVKTDKKFAEALLREGVDAMLSGDVETGKTILRDTIKATVGFEKLGEATDTPPKSLIRMFGPRGNPQARNLFSVIGYLQKRAGVQLHVSGQAGGRARWRAKRAISSLILRRACTVAGHDVVFCHAQFNLEAVKKNGLKIESVHGNAIGT